jgi:hypothetical protein
MDNVLEKVTRYYACRKRKNEKLECIPDKTWRAGYPGEKGHLPPRSAGRIISGSILERNPQNRHQIIIPDHVGICTAGEI